MRDDLVQILKIATQEALAKRPSEQTKKAHQDYVTDVDLALDALLNAALTNLTPDVPVLSEEREITALPDRFWMVDPIDGTANLISGIPFVGIAVALIENGETTLAGVADIHHGAIGALIAREAGMHYKAHPEGPLADDNQRSICCHPAHINAITDLKLWETTT